MKLFILSLMLVLPVGCLFGSTVNQNLDPSLFILASTRQRPLDNIKTWVNLEKIQMDMRRTEWTYWKLAFLLFVTSSICAPIFYTKANRRFEEARKHAVQHATVSVSMYLHSRMLYYKPPFSERLLTAATFLDHIPKCLFPE